VLRWISLSSPSPSSALFDRCCYVSKGNGIVLLTASVDEFPINGIFNSATKKEEEARLILALPPAASGIKS
jgi:hypothetical protein